MNETEKPATRPALSGEGRPRQPSPEWLAGRRDYRRRSAYHLEAFEFFPDLKAGVAADPVKNIPA